MMTNSEEIGSKSTMIIWLLQSMLQVPMPDLDLVLSDFEKDQLIAEVDHNQEVYAVAPIKEAWDRNFHFKKKSN